MRATASSSMRASTDPGSVPARLIRAQSKHIKYYAPTVLTDVSRPRISLQQPSGITITTAEGNPALGDLLLLLGGQLIAIRLVIDRVFQISLELRYDALEISEIEVLI